MQIDNDTIDPGSPRKEWQNPKAPWAPYLITIPIVQTGQDQYFMLLKYMDSTLCQIITLITIMMRAVIVTMSGLYCRPAMGQTQFSAAPEWSHRNAQPFGQTHPGNILAPTGTPQSLHSHPLTRGQSRACLCKCSFNIISVDCYALPESSWLMSSSTSSQWERPLAESGLGSSWHLQGWHLNNLESWPLYSHILSSLWWPTPCSAKPPSGDAGHQSALLDSGMWGFWGSSPVPVLCRVHLPGLNTLIGRRAQQHVLGTDSLTLLPTQLPGTQVPASAHLPEMN